MSEKYYLAYGSNLNVKQMQLRCPCATPIGVTHIPNYELIYKGSKTGAYLTIRQKDGCSVPAAVWRVTGRDEAALDRYEGFPSFYYKISMRVTVLDMWEEKERVVTAFVYLMHEHRRYGLPTTEYIKTCAQGYVDFGLDQAALNRALARTREEMEKK